MRVIIIGAGEVGSSIAAGLADDHEVVVVDIDGDRVDDLTYSIDVLAIQGDGTSMPTLEEAGIDRADMLIASTDNDETNIVACNAAKIGGEVFTIARVKKPDLLDTWHRSNRAFGVDFMVCTDLLSAQAIVTIVGLPAARDADPFAGGSIQMAEFEIPEDSSVTGQTVAEADRFDSLTFVGLLRGETVEITRGETVLQAGDYVVVIGSPESVQLFGAELSPEQTPGSAEEIVIVGGSEIGFQVARLLEDQGLSPRLIEADHDRARDLAERLPNTVVMESDATDMEFLTREHIDEADVVISALTHDESNLLISLLAKQLGTSRAVAVVEHGDYVDIFEAVGVDAAINPREITAEEITRFTHEGRAENIALIHNDRAEVLEVEINRESILAGRTLQESMAELPDAVVIGAITREGECLIPRGDTRIEVGDHVVVFARTDVVDAAAAVL
ncbi:Trk system potassium transporter TrkA [Halalkalicoccus jeotgali]|uniref:Potassium transporter peripheral membrane component n=1 Tax=Halalkalicoccus jeotgali (strain DSM 18796 / CECT 7217 / JCM 14584 / KCTC 4019 / B3) TaxID=795797 RepID=D8J648_HALJB|nr:Trk system potassium transporter TrkA [Halalkalicoccus jeotgali]ADJ15766.1 potassium transporter peripheral membrane component [Halalkalicoccus jeotgali B3]ELY37210.1 potassium transporter peripheral membrane component [Halalkalicoccus jeotgali B3]